MCFFTLVVLWLSGFNDFFLFSKHHFCEMTWFIAGSGAGGQRWLYLAYYIEHLTLRTSAAFQDPRKVTHLLNNTKLNYSAGLFFGMFVSLF